MGVSVHGFCGGLWVLCGCGCDTLSDTVSIYTHFFKFMNEKVLKSGTNSFVRRLCPLTA